MRILVTGAANPYGAAVARAAADAGHDVRAFGIPAGKDPFHDARIACFPGLLASGGSIEPVASQCEAIVHCSAFDAMGKDKVASGVQLSKGTMYARYSAERELVSQFIAVFPTQPARALSAAVQASQAEVAATRKIVPHVILRASTPEDAAKQAVAQLAKAPKLVA